MIRSTARGGPCAPAQISSPTSGRTGSRLDAHVEVEVTWLIYQWMIAAYRHADHRQGRALTVKLINSISSGVVKSLTKVITLGRMLKNRAVDVLAYFDLPDHIQRTDRDDRRPPRAPTRLSTRIPKPRQLHRQITARNRRIQTPTTPSTVKSPSSSILTTTTKLNASISGCHVRRWPEPGRLRRSLVVTPMRHWRRHDEMR